MSSEQTIMVASSIKCCATCTSFAGIKRLQAPFPTKHIEVYPDDISICFTDNRFKIKHSDICPLYNKLASLL